MGYSDVVLADAPLVYWRLGDTFKVAAATASTSFGSEPAINAFDKDPATNWTTNGPATGWLRAQLAIATALTQYRITRRDDIPTRNPVTWTFEGSNDGTTFTVLDTQTGITWPTAGEVKTFAFTNVTAYLYYRINVTAINGGADYLSIAELNLGEVLADSSGNGRHGAIKGAVVQGALGSLPRDTNTAFTFPGTTSSFTQHPWAAWANVSALTVEARIKTTVGGYQSIIDRDTGSASFPNRAFQFRLNVGKLEFVRITNAAGGDGVVIAASPAVVSDGAWHSVAATYDGTTILLYVDGVLVTTTAAPGGINQPASTSAVKYAVGINGPGTTTGSAPFNGTIDEVAYYGTALSGARIAAHHAAVPLATRVLLVTADTAHASYTRTKAALESRGHVVVGSLDTVAALDTAWAAGTFNAIVTVRMTTGTSPTATMGWLRDKWVAGTPLLIGGLEAGGPADATVHFAEWLGVLKDARLFENTTQTASYAKEMRVRSGSHPIVSGYLDGTEYAVVSVNSYTTLDWFVVAQSGTLLGDNYNSPGTYGVYMTAVDTGEALVVEATNTLGQTVAPARVVFCGWLYAGQSDYTANAKIILGRAVDWLAPGVIEEVTANSTATGLEFVAQMSDLGGSIGELTATGLSFTAQADSFVAASSGVLTATGLGFSATANSFFNLLTAGVTTNRVGGRNRDGIGEATWDPPVTAVPVELVNVIGASKDVALSFTVPVMVGVQPTYTVSKWEKPSHRDRIVVAGKDVTFFRDVATPFPGFSLIEPLMYGPTQITFPQIAAAFERPGHGDLAWLRKFAPVLIERVDIATGEVVATDYRGLIVGYDADGGSLTVSVGGEATGRAAMMNRQIPLFPVRRDLGRMAYNAIRGLGLHFDPYLGPITGIKVRQFGGVSMLEYLNQIVAMSWNREGNRWTVMPTRKGVYEMKRKDVTTIDGTVYADDTQTVASLTRDLSEEPNRIFMTGVTPEGQKVRFGAYPGLKQTNNPPAYPVAGNAAFGQGTTDAQTTSGEGITVMYTRLRTMGYLSAVDAPGGYDIDMTRAIKALQREADLNVTGNMNLASWRALWDLSATGFSLGWSRILPAAELSKVRQWRRSPSGAILGRNPNYDKTWPKVDRNVDAGPGFTRPQLREWAGAEMEDGSEDNWVGTITFGTGGFVDGLHVPGTPLTAAHHRRARSLRPGMNLWLPLFDGGVKVHVSAVTVDASGTVSATVDTRARDAMEVWAVIERDRDNRRSPYREWLRDRRRSTMTQDALIEWDEVGGLLGNKVTLEANKWTIFPIVAGQEGTVRRIKMRTNPNAEFVMAVFGKRIWPNRLRTLIGNPLTKEGAKNWNKESTRDSLEASNILLYVAGSNDEPLGYYPKQKTASDDAGSGKAPLTGRWQDDAGFSYFTGDSPVVWVAVYADRDTVIPSGRMMWNQLEAGA